MIQRLDKVKAATKYFHYPEATNGKGVVLLFVLKWISQSKQ